jgi:hypothetical protein
MKRTFILLLFTTLPVTWLLSPGSNLRVSSEFGTPETQRVNHAEIANLLSKFNDTEINQSALEFGFLGYLKLRRQNKIRKDILVIIDFTKSSNEERLYIISPEAGTLLHQSVVAHGRNSGNEYATRFSNRVGSNQSSLGFYRTAKTYQGKHGLSLRLDGLEKDINDQARKRAVVIHSASYANPDFAKKHGRLGRSFGCPALPQKNYSKVIEWIKEGALVFIYHSSSSYFHRSTVLDSQSK